jgi:hypothetical protein
MQLDTAALLTIEKVAIYCLAIRVDMVLCAVHSMEGQKDPGCSCLALANYCLLFSWVSCYNNMS